MVEIQKEHLNTQEAFNKEKFMLQKENLELKKLVIELEFKIKHKTMEQIGIVKK